MHKIQWNDCLSVGIKKLDEQHKELIRIINSLLERENLNDHPEDIAEALDRMTKYADYHFHTEEKLMLEYGYPGHASHHSEHTAFKARTANFCIDAIAQKPALPRELLSYLATWLTNHILQSDMQYKAYFEEKGLAESSPSGK
jgi:hemerythrin